MHTENLQRDLRRIFNLEQFIPTQLAAINAALSIRNTFILMPSGGGKSLIYQMVAMQQKGLMIVI
jgi:superfamily II DNA helicase RecQ